MCPFPKGTFIVSFHYINSNILISSNYVKKEKLLLEYPSLFSFFLKKDYHRIMLRIFPHPRHPTCKMRHPPISYLSPEGSNLIRAH